MNKQELVQKSLRAAALAGQSSSMEMLANRANQPLLIRLGKVSFAKLLAPFVPGCLPGELKGLKRLRSGGEQIVYTDGENALKIIFGSITHNENEAAAIAHVLQDRFDTAQKIMSRHLLETTYSPLSLYGWFAVGALQKLQRPKASFRNIEELVAYDDSLGYRRRLNAFSAATLELHNATSLYPDLLGEHNVIYRPNSDGGTVSVIDNMLVTPDMQQKIEATTGLPVGELIASKIDLINQAINNGSRTTSGYLPPVFR